MKTEQQCGPSTNRQQGRGRVGRFQRPDPDRDQVRQQAGNKRTPYGGVCGCEASPRRHIPSPTRCGLQGDQRHCKEQDAAKYGQGNKPGQRGAGRIPCTASTQQFHIFHSTPDSTSSGHFLSDPIVKASRGGTSISAPDWPGWSLADSSTRVAALHRAVGPAVFLLRLSRDLRSAFHRWGEKDGLLDV